LWRSYSANHALMNKTALWIIGVLVVVGAFVWWYSATAPAATGDVSGAATTTPEDFGADPKDGGAVTVVYSDDGFVPTSITVRPGTVVTFIDQSAAHEMWVASDEHPTHTQYDGTNKDEHCPNTAGTTLDQCAEGSTYSFTFSKPGVWSYHNHREDEHHGSVTVTQ